MALAAIAGLGAVVAPSGPAQASVFGTEMATSRDGGPRVDALAQKKSERQAIKAIRRTFGGGPTGWRYKRGPGWSFAHVKRMARKRRNVMRNRKAHRA